MFHPYVRLNRSARFELFQAVVSYGALGKNHAIVLASHSRSLAIVTITLPAVSRDPCADQFLYATHSISSRSASIRAI